LQDVYLGASAKYAEFDRTGVSKFAGDFTTRRFWLEAELSL
jgi:hypothetical protein